MSNFYTTIDGLKRFAKKLQNEFGIPLHEALEKAAQMGGFQNFMNARRQLTLGSRSHSIVITDRWHEYDPPSHGSAKAAMDLEVALEQLVRPHNLTGYLGGYSFGEPGRLYPHHSSRRESKNTTIYSIARALRTLQFIAATGLRPSSAYSSCYPKRDWDNRPPIADHDHCWFDPVARVHVLTTEPYPGRAQSARQRQREWEQRHGWSTIIANWGSIYGFDTEFYLCCPTAYAPTLRQKIAALERSASAIGDGVVDVETRYKKAA